MSSHEEIERRFLLKPFSLEDMRRICIGEWKKKRISQYYLKAEENGVRKRYRKIGNEYRCTIKSGEGLVRQENEYAVSESEYIEHMDLMYGKPIEKIRYIFNCKGELYELDIFLGDLEGLIILEVEFPTLEKAFDFILPDPFPSITIAEVTADKRFSNAFLSSSESIPSINESALFSGLNPHNAYLLSVQKVLELWMGHHGKRITSSVKSIDFKRDFEFLHDARTSARRVLTYLELFHLFFEKEWALELSDKIRIFLGKSGFIRDTDVMIESMDRYEKRIPRKLRKQLKRLKNELHRKRDESLERFHKSSLPPDDLLNAEVRFNSMADMPLYIALPRILEEYMEILIPMISKARKKRSDKVYHEIRIYIKRLRYLIELSGVYIDKERYEKLYSGLVDTQTLLGEFHDIYIQRKRIRKILKKNSSARGGKMIDLLNMLLKLMEKRSKKLKKRIKILLDELKKNRAVFKTLYLKKLEYSQE